LAVIRDVLADFIKAIRTDGLELARIRSSTDRALCRSLVQILLGDACEIAPAEIAQVQRVLKRVHYFMAGHLDRSVRLDQLCVAADVKRENLERIFRNYVGLDPIQYLEACRLNQVFKALRRADPAGIDVGEIARAWGFAQLNSFTRQFTGMFGKSPPEILQEAPRLIQ
jgi:transcriptional regulator GlxA family with amidase domain